MLYIGLAATGLEAYRWPGPPDLWAASPMVYAKPTKQVTYHAT